MKTLRIILPMAALFFLYVFADAQNCQGNKIMVYQGGTKCGCHCKKKCITPDQLQGYLDSGWNTAGCFNCCWVSDDEKSVAPYAELHEDNSYSTQGALTVAFTLPEKSDVKIELSDITGRYVATVADEFFEDTENELIWDQDEVTPGLYLLTIQSGANHVTRMVSVTD